MPSIPAIVALTGLGATRFFAFACVSSSRDFFSRVVSVHPELENELAVPGVFTRYGPIRPSYMRYLKQGRHNRLEDPLLQAQGRRILQLLNAHAISFVVFVLGALWWAA